jgi:hypothetical protein
MTGKRFEELMEEAAREYNAPPETPRQDIWAAVKLERDRDEFRNHSQGFRMRHLWTVVAAAAILLIGIAMGRMSIRENAEIRLAEIERNLEERNRQDLYEMAATTMLSRTETMLTQYRSGTLSGYSSTRIAAWAGSLLMETRLLMDSPAGEDPEFVSLLQDLELVLARIQQVESRDSIEERGRVTRSLEEGSIISRLRAKIPAGEDRTGV